MEKEDELRRERKLAEQMREEKLVDRARSIGFNW